MKLFARSLFVKLLSAAGAGTLVMVAAGMYALLNAMAGLDAYQRLLDRQVTADHAVLRMQATFKEQVQEWKNVLIRGADPQALEKYWAQFQAKEAEVQKSASELTGTLEGEPEARELVTRFAAAHRDMGQSYRRGLEAFRASRFDTAVGDKAVKGIDREATEYLTEASRVIAASVQKTKKKVQDDSARAVRVGMTLVAATLLGAAFFFLWIVRRYVVGPTAIVMRELEALAAGDFSQPVTRHGEDEIGRLADSAERIRVHLGKTLAEVVQSAKQLAHAAERLADVSHVASEGVAAQQKEVELVATAINEMSSTVNEVARSAATAAEAAGNADQESRAGRETVSRTIDDIDRLAGEIESTAKAVAAVEGQSRNISSVIDVIRGIAEQTNLLALNAAIEAARAGEQGRGFAVVADEVRTLASRTHKSTQEIQELISQLQSGTHNAVEVMGRSRGLAGETVNQAAGARQALETITGAIGRINDMNTQIASASEEQGAVAEELNRNIIRINQVAEESAAGSQQIASASRELNTLARQLESLTGRFKL